MTLEQLAAKLEGTYDLTDLADCQSVIRMLLRNLDAANARAERANTDLKSLAFQVHRGNDDKAHEKAEAILAGCKRPAGEVMAGLMKMSDEMGRASDLNDTDLTTEVFKEVWGELTIDGRPSAVLEEMIHRFKVMTGQEVADDNEA
jgi:hypothetical protein